MQGTRGIRESEVGLCDRFPLLHEESRKQKNLIEPYVPEEKIVESATKCTNRFIIRRAQGVPLVKSVHTDLLFRPYWAAYYGEAMEGKKFIICRFKQTGIRQPLQPKKLKKTIQMKS
ncbi:MAG: hypothetical protein AAGU27_21155 [Dehalobacterium sp.]